MARTFKTLSLALSLPPGVVQELTEIGQPVNCTGARVAAEIVLREVKARSRPQKERSGRNRRGLLPGVPVSPLPLQGQSLTLQTSAMAITAVSAILATYYFRANDEGDLQAQVAEILENCVRFRVGREVAVGRGRYDILVEVLGVDSRARDADMRGCRLVLELKVGGTAEAAARQAQRYARDEGVDAVAVVTSSRRLALEIQRGGALERRAGVECLGGKAFGVIALRAL